jgi:hypothetical protein
VPISYYYVVNITKRKYAMKINLKVPSKKENENNERKKRKEKFVKSDVGSNVLEETEEKIVF